MASYTTAYFIQRELNYDMEDKQQRFTDWCQGWANSGWHLEHITTIGWGMNSLIHTCIWTRR